MSTKHPPWAPYAPVKYTREDVLAIQSLATGTATEDQQKRALRFIIEAVARTYDVSFCPGPDGDRETAMAEGRRFVGLQLITLLQINVGVVFREER